MIWERTRYLCSTLNVVTNSHRFITTLILLDSWNKANIWAEDNLKERPNFGKSEVTLGNKKQIGYNDSAGQHYEQGSYTRTICLQPYMDWEDCHKLE